MSRVHRLTPVVAPNGRGRDTHPPTGALAGARESRSRAKKSFIAATSHELRTPLNAIIGFAEIIDAELYGPLSVPQYHSYVRDILGSARHLLQIIEDVLDITDAEAGELVLNKREVDIGALVALSLLAVREQSRSKRIKIVADLAEDLVIKVDPERLERALASLLSNAVKFSAAGSTVRVAVRLQDCERVIISIEDYGIGMDPQSVERTFAPFVQLDDELSRTFEGSGLGLPLARLLAELHGGSIRLDSALGAGTTATLVLPAYAGSATRAASGRRKSMRRLRRLSIRSGFEIVPATSSPSASPRRNAD